MDQNQDQYGFIMNPGNGSKGKKSLLPSGFSFSGASKRQLIAFGAGALLLLIIMITILFSTLNGGPKNKDHLLAAVALQNELIRVSEVAVKEARGTQARNLAQTTRLSLRSDQASLSAALKAQNVKVGARELNAAKKADTDQKLTEAQQNNRFDEFYLEFIQAQLVDYQKKLKTAYDTSVDTKLKTTMKAQYENASIIIGVDPET